MYHPWQHFRQQAQWVLRFEDLPARVRGVTDFATNTVTLCRSLTQVERRCTITHELIHIERGPIPRAAFAVLREEETVRQETARRLIPIHDLGEALAWSDQPAEVADELWVTVDVLRTRLQHLHPSERAYLLKRLEYKE